MHKLFDKTLASRISEVFQDHQEAYMPGDWEKLLAKMTEGKKGMLIWLPYIAKAASIVIFIGLSVFTVNENSMNKQKYSESKTESGNTERIVLATVAKKEDNSKNSKNQVKSITKSNKLTKIIQIDKPENPNIEIEKSEIELVTIIDSFPETYFDDKRYANVKENLKKNREAIIKMNNVKNDFSRLYLVEDNFDIAETEETGDLFDVGVELSSVSNYAAEGTGNSINVGGGISTSWNISKHLSLASGMIVARQSMNYNQSESMGQLRKNKSGDYAMENSLEMVDLNTAESELEFVGIDIPINVQFKLKRLVLSTGFSSIIHIQEKYNYSYSSNVTNTVYNLSMNRYETQSNVNQVNEQEKSEIFSHFDFASLVNFAVGYNIPLPKGAIVIEPYIKLPIGSISSQQVKMGSGGFAFKYYF